MQKCIVWMKHHVTKMNMICIVLPSIDTTEMSLYDTEL